MSSKSGDSSDEEDSRVNLVDTKGNGNQVIPGYDRVSFKTNSLKPIADQLGSILGLSCTVLHEPSNSIRHLNIQNNSDIDQKSMTREIALSYYKPLLATETVFDLSENFLTTDQTSQYVKMYEAPKLSFWPLASFTCLFKMAKSKFELYQKRYASSVWIFSCPCETGGPEVKKFKLIKESLVDSVIFVFLKRMSVEEDDSIVGEKNVPMWTFRGPAVSSVEDKVVVVKGVFYANSRSLEGITFNQRNCRMVITLVNNISPIIKGMRMIALKNLPVGCPPEQDYNVSPILDCIMGVSQFNCNIYSKGQSLDEKVDRLMNCHDSSLLILDGGPGTGKTTSAINALSKVIKQKLAHNVQFKILLCAASNSATDVLYTKISKKFPTMFIFRVGESVKISSEVEKKMTQKQEMILRKLQCEEATGKEAFMLKYGESSSMSLARKIFFSEASVIVSTLGSTQTTELVSARGKITFDILLIDEAGQAKFDETLLPLHFTSIRRLFIVGDPRQLGPIYKSPMLHKLPAEKTSLFISLCSTFANQSGVVHRLRVQHRMHHFVADVVNRVSYRGDVVLQTSESGGWRRVEKHRPFAVFSSETWTESISGSTMSKCSEDEAKFGIRVLKAALGIAGYNFVNNSFGSRVPITFAVIPLYQSQVGLFRHLVKRENLQHVVRVSTVDQMQGSEVDIAIVSAVRASDDFNRSVGFASDIRRLNVALSRAGAVYVMAKGLSFRSVPGWSKVFIAAANNNCLYPFAGAYTDDELVNILAV